jgi:SAM-dependent methyltransferase
MKTSQNSRSTKADYGQDMPGILVALAVIAIIQLALACWKFFEYSVYQKNTSLIAAIIFISIASLFLSIVIAGIWSSRYGKLILRDKVLGMIEFKGNESILDLGCGRGLLLIDAAKKIPEGKAVGADVWSGNLEYKNSPEMVMQNANVEGVSDRVEIVTADAQDLPFHSESYDVVMTSLMMHHIADRNKALHEMVRVLKPDGTLIVADVNSKHYERIFKSLGLAQVEIHYATRLFLFPAYVVKGLKSKEK